MKLYMKVTQDKFSLPLDVDTSPTKLAKRQGVNVNSVLANIWRQKVGRIKGYPRFVCVEVEDGDNVHESNHR